MLAKSSLGVEAPVPEVTRTELDLIVVVQMELEIERRKSHSWIRHQQLNCLLLGYVPAVDSNYTWP